MLAAHDPAARVAMLDGETMGTGWGVRCAVPPTCALVPLQHAIDQRLAQLVAEMSHWQRTSVLSRFNASPAGAIVQLPDDFATVLQLSLQVAQASASAFDPAIGRLVDLWGFGPPGPQPPPTCDGIAATRACSGWRRLRWDPGTRRLRQPGGLALDLSGVAKGHAVDAIADLLAARGIAHCLVEVGGELVGRGLKPDGEPWWVDLEAPPATDVPPIRLALHRCAVATSGDYRRGAHSIDPRTGHPAANGVASVTVVAATAALADALATAITVAYPDETLIAALDVAARIILRIDGQVREVRTPRFAAMLA